MSQNYYQDLLNDAVLLIEMARSIIDTEDTAFHSQSAGFLAQAAMGEKYAAAVGLAEKVQEVSNALSELSESLPEEKRELLTELTALSEKFDSVK